MFLGRSQLAFGMHIFQCLRYVMSRHGGFDNGVHQPATGGHVRIRESLAILLDQFLALCRFVFRFLNLFAYTGGSTLAAAAAGMEVTHVDADEHAPYSSEALAQRLFGSPRGDTVTYSSYFDEVSGGLLHVTGNVTSWIHLAHPASYYLAKEEYGWGRFGKVREVRNEALAQVSASVNLGQFDNDGPDGQPNSGDDDGFVDFVVFVYALPCGPGSDVHRAYRPRGRVRLQPGRHAGMLHGRDGGC